MQENSQVTAVIINYRTGELVRRAVESFRKFYPEVPLLLIDNGSNDDSVQILKELVDDYPLYTDLIANNKNLHHGPAMDQAMNNIKSPYVLFIDSDCEIYRGDFVGLMIQSIEENNNNYIVGKKIYMDKRGFDTADRNDAVEYIRPICMLVKRDVYLTLPEFILHGTPCLNNMKKAVEQGLKLIDFPIDNYVKHLGRGTAGKYGYRLGWRGRVNYLFHKLGM